MSHGASMKGEIKQPNQSKTTVMTQILAAIGPLLMTVGVGMTSGYSAILLPQLERNDSIIRINEEESSWLASMAALPMAIGSLLGGLFIEKFGRKTTHMITCPPMISGWLLISFAFSTKMILTGRFITGFCTGMLGSATGVYIGETSEPKYRGFLLAGISFSVSLGLLLSHLFGTFFHWQTTASLCALFPLFGFIIMLFVPESPSWLAKKGKLQKAEKSFHQCRGYSEESRKELTVMLERQEAQSRETTMTMKDVISKMLVPEFLKPLAIIIVYIVANQWSGVNAITFYTVSIMKDTIGDGVNKYLAMLLVDGIRVVMSIIACILLRKFGRRPLAIISGTGTFLSLFILSSFTYLVKIFPQISTQVYIPMTALVAYIAFISIGYVPLPWALIGELFPLRSRSLGSGISSFMAFTAFFSVVKSSPRMFQDLGPSGTFLVYGIVAFVGTVFVYFYLPETKGKPLHEIEDHFKKRECKTLEIPAPDTYKMTLKN